MEEFNDKIEEFDVEKMEVDSDNNVSPVPQFEEKPKRKVDPSETELKEYFKQVRERTKQLDIKGGAKEFTFEDGFSCIARDEKNANRKHQNWIDNQ